MPAKIDCLSCPKKLRKLRNKPWTPGGGRFYSKRLKVAKHPAKAKVATRKGRRSSTVPPRRRSNR